MENSHFLLGEEGYWALGEIKQGCVVLFGLAGKECLNIIQVFFLVEGVDEVQLAVGEDFVLDEVGLAFIFCTFLVGGLLYTVHLDGGPSIAEDREGVVGSFSFQEVTFSRHPLYGLQRFEIIHYPSLSILFPLLFVILLRAVSRL